MSCAIPLGRRRQFRPEAGAGVVLLLEQRLCRRQVYGHYSRTTGPGDGSKLHNFSLHIIQQQQRLGTLRGTPNPQASGLAETASGGGGIILCLVQYPWAARGSSDQRPGPESSSCWSSGYAGDSFTVTMAERRAQVMAASFTNSLCISFNNNSVSGRFAGRLPHSPGETPGLWGRRQVVIPCPLQRA